MPDYHARLSPSGAKRWMTCPGSQNMIEQAIKLHPELANQTSKYAAEGTVAHTIGEKCLKGGMVADDFLGKTFKQDGYTITVTQDMTKAVQVYVDWVLDYVQAAAEQADVKVDVLLEVWGDLTFLNVPAMEGGTSDCVLVCQEHQFIVVGDYKHGAGVAVEVEDNPQALSYAAGALKKLDLWDDDFELEEWQVELAIIQPRAQHPDGPIRTKAYTALEVKEWVLNELVPAGHATHEEDAPLVPSDDACRFCEAGGICDKRYEYAQQLAIADFQQDLLPAANMMTAEQKATVMDHADMLRSFIVAVENQIKLEINAGSKDYEGKYKLVRKNTHRKLTDDATDPYIGELLEYLNIEDIYEPRLKSLGDVEAALKKKVGTKRAKELMEELTNKPEGELVVARQSDKRQSVQPEAFSDFDGLED